MKKYDQTVSFVCILDNWKAKWFHNHKTEDFIDITVDWLAYSVIVSRGSVTLLVVKTKSMELNNSADISGFHPLWPKEP